MAADFQRRSREHRFGMRFALLSFVTVSLLALGGWWMLTENRPDAALEPAAAPAPHSGTESGLERHTLPEAVERSGVEAPAAASAPAAEEGPPEATPAPPEAMLLTGAAVRVEPDGSEHAGLDGRLKLYAQVAGDRERKDIEVTAGRFAVELPPDATLSVQSLTLGGVAVALEETTFGVPADRFLLLRGVGMRSVLLHVLDARDRSELSDVEVHAAGVSAFASTRRHPGAEPEGDPLLLGVPSPVLVLPPAESRRSAAVYWLRSPGFAWTAVTLEHAAGGERTVELVRGGSLTVALDGLADWLEPEVRLWPPDAGPDEVYAYAARVPDAEQCATFTDVVPGTYNASVERGWDRNRVSFGQTTVEVLAGEHTRAVIAVILPERPQPVRVAGHLTLTAGWEQADTRLVFEAQDDASVWMAGELTLAATSMALVRGNRYAWEVTLPVAGNYELAIQPQWLRQLLVVPPEGLEDVELVVPAPALVEVSVVDGASGEEIGVERLYWRPLQVEGVRMTPLLSATADPTTGRVTFRAPAMPIQLSGTDRTLVLLEEQQSFELEPGKNVLELHAERQIRVHFRFLDGEAEVPWSWGWRLRAQRIDGPGRDVARGIGMLYFRELGAYELYSDGIPGYASIDGTPFDVRAPRPGEEESVVVVRLERE